jgi:hypothetical protein
MNDATTAVESSTVPGTILEERWLSNNEPISRDQADRETAELGPDWRLETPHEAFADVDYDHKNEHNALSRNPERRRGAYWTNRPYPLGPAARVVVWFGVGLVDDYYDYDRARARAVRVSGQ